MGSRLLHRTIRINYYLRHPLKTTQKQCMLHRTFPKPAYNLSCEALVYRKHGAFSDVLHLEDMPLYYNGKDDIHIRMLAAPVNPADINMLHGNYGITPRLPAIGGNEGVGKVIKVGCSVNSVKPGDWVIPIDSGFGTWRTHAVCQADKVTSIPNDISLISAATISVNPCTAYRMLMDFVQLNPGETVIQNGANSAVGQAVIQICSSMGINTINVIRDRSNVNTLIEKLKSLGATYVITEETLQKREMADIFKVVERPKLALNCVGGRSAGDLFTHLRDGSTMVTYGGMSLKPTPVPAKAVIFRNIKLCGFWMTQWKKDHVHDVAKMKGMLLELIEMVRKGSLLEPTCTQVPFKEYKSAFQASLDPYSNKNILIME
ncbi:enoyl-[acyl-carrier-protein] reductase, mitochondrial [Xenopus laevis]|uniref:Enoyl-[acyl-carrier-protein] reductase, mitochondrial n=2 Tax=Xenopus laevis TaxID=8355 RepID=A0A974CWM0_XENLA|nr:enoyl-[acyl-carrier-protein] reductase, mitochondrial [Xenopus laevis]OCT80166.1 hypothetical protein XELAEV_18026981mg [Xenopus laevis]